MARPTDVRGPRPARLRRFTRAASATVIVCVGLLTTAGASHAATAVPLGTAGDFAILAGSGITNTGATTIAGDVGSSPTSSQTGFAACPAADCVTLTGGNHIDPDPNDATTVLAKQDLTRAYDDAAGQTATRIPTELAGETLAPGAYDSASGTFGISGTVVLDGENDPNAVFVFQTTSTLITAAASNVSLVRGAQSCNVFWQVGSAATLGEGSTFRGTILAHDDISLGAAVTVDGRLLAGEQPSGIGAVTLDGDTIIRPSCAVPEPPVPVPSPPVTGDDAGEAEAEAAAAAAAAAAASAAIERERTWLAAVAATEAAEAEAIATAAAKAEAARQATAAKRSKAERRAAARRAARADRAWARRQAGARRRAAKARRVAARRAKRAAAREAARIGVPKRARGQRPGFTG